jgi:ribonucleoside-diphosphate reductase alpha subunit
MYMNGQDNVIKRNGDSEIFSFDKISKRIILLGKNELTVNYTTLVKKIADRIYNEITTREIDELLAQQCASQTTTHPDYGILASRVLISNHHKNTNGAYNDTIIGLYNYTDMHGKHCPIISKRLYDLVMENLEEIEKMFKFNRDYLFDYFGFKTLERAYLLKINDVIVERPQHMWMRVALSIHGSNLEKVKNTYDLLSMKYFIHATPTLFNAGTTRQQLSSCFLLAMEDDSINGIYSTLSDCAKISKWAGGIGIHIHNVRAAGSKIRGTNGVSNGIVPMLRVFNNTARYVDQGGGKRNGSFAIYLEPWHKDINAFLDMRKTHGDEEMRARDLFYALWIPDLFMERVKGGDKWTLMCPDECPGLSDCYGDNFKRLYEEYETKGRGVTVNARDIWFKILDAQIETGTPYMLYKDACNQKSNQKNLGVIKSSNLCTEIVEYSDSKETAVCNLASISLPHCVEPFNINKMDKIPKEIIIYTVDKCDYCLLSKNLLKKNNIHYTEVTIAINDKDKFKEKMKIENGIEIKTFPVIMFDDEYIGGFTELLKIMRPTYNYKKLHKIVKIVTENLNNIININYYSTEKASNSNLKHRPIGIGVQGLADMFMMMDLAFDCDEAKIINEKIFETIYHGAIEKSCELAAEHGSYSSFGGSPASHGKLSFDLWGYTPKYNTYNWDSLRKKIKKHGLRNSLLIAPMPTASTSQILGNNECFEPFTSNIYVRRTNAGEFVMTNKYLIRELGELGLWNEVNKNNIIKNNGSVQNMDIPKHLKEKYKIVWEIPMKNIIDMASDRAPFIDQSMSMNLWMKDPTYDKLTAMHFYSYSKGLKTGLYYLRTKAKASPQQFTIEPTKINENEEPDDNVCEACSA